MFCDLICVTIFKKLLSCCLTKVRHQKSKKSVMRKNETAYNMIWLALIGPNLATQAFHFVKSEGWILTSYSSNWSIDICVVICFVIESKAKTIYMSPCFQKSIILHYLQEKQRYQVTNGNSETQRIVQNASGPKFGHITIIWLIPNDILSLFFADVTRCLVCNMIFLFIPQVL